MIWLENNLFSNPLFLHSNFTNPSHPITNTHTQYLERCLFLIWFPISTKRTEKQEEENVSYWLGFQKRLQHWTDCPIQISWPNHYSGAWSSVWSATQWCDKRQYPAITHCGMYWRQLLGNYKDNPYGITFQTSWQWERLTETKKLYNFFLHNIQHYWWKHLKIFVFLYEKVIINQFLFSKYDNIHVQ